MTKTKTELAADLVERTGQLNKAIDEVGALRAQIEGMEKEASKNHAELLDAADRLRESVSRQNMLANKNNELAETNAVLVRTASTAVHTATTDLRDRLTEAEQVGRTWRRRAETAEKESTTRAQERDDARAQAQGARDHRDRLVGQIDKLRNELAEASKDVAMKHGDIVELTKQRDSSQTDVKLVRAQRDSWKEAAETATRRANDNEAWANRAEAWHDEAQKKNAVLAQKFDSMQMMALKLSDDVRELSAERDQERARAERAEHERADARTALASLRSSLSAQRKAGHDTGVSLAASAGDCERTHARLTDAEARVETLEELLRNAHGGLSSFVYILGKELPES